MGNAEKARSDGHGGALHLHTRSDAWGLAVSFLFQQVPLLSQSGLRGIVLGHPQ